MTSNPIGPIRAVPQTQANRGEQVLLAQGGRPTATAPAESNGKPSRHEQFHLQSYLGFRGPGQALQVKLGYTAKGDTAIQTATATYAVPAGVDGREAIRQWVQQAHRSGAISGVYPAARPQQPAPPPPAFQRSEGVGAWISGLFQTKSSASLDALRGPGKFHLQSYLGFQNTERELQVKLGYTDKGDIAIQTATATYAVPAGANNRQEIRQWVQQAHRSGAISGAYTLNAGARPQPAAPQRSSEPVDLWGLAFPDALVYTLGAAKQAHRRDFALLNPFSGSLTQFIAHKNDTVQFGSLKLSRVETVHYSLAGAPVFREDGLTWSGKLSGGATAFLNVRGGDSNLRSRDTALSGNIGFFGPPSALKSVAKALKVAGASQAAAGFDRTLRAAGTFGSEYGLAWRASVNLDKRSGELMVNLSGHKIPLHQFIGLLDLPGTYNEGLPRLAHNINQEAYLAGANPYAFADGTRGEGGRFRNHGDPVSAIAGGILKLAAEVQPGAAPVRTNADARRVVELALAREADLIDPNHARLFGVLRVPAGLSPESRQALSSTLKLLERYNMDFGSPAIRRAAEPGAASGVRPSDVQFVRDVFQGNFRVSSLDGGAPANQVTDALVYGLNRFLGLAATVLSPRTVAGDDVTLMQSRVRVEGLKARLDGLHGGALKALGVSTQGLPAAQRDRMESNALSILGSALTKRILRQGGALSIQTLYGAFVGLRQDERAMLGAQIDGKILDAVEVDRIASRLDR